MSEEISANVLEKLYVDKNYSIERLAERFHVSKQRVRKELIALGLEVDGKVMKGLTSSSKAEFDEDAAKSKEV
jgi:DeoR/GlpR family transcriptional regulator of sugar metabolism